MRRPRPAKPVAVIAITAGGGRLAERIAAAIDVKAEDYDQTAVRPGSGEKTIAHAAKPL